MNEAMRLSVAGAAVTLTLMTGLWVLHLRIRNAGVVDVGWAAGIGMLAVLYALFGSGDPARRMLAAVLGGVWSLRLTLHLATRVGREAEDGRYRAIREKWRTNIAVKFLGFFLMQGALDVFLAVPFLFAAVNPRAGIGVFEIAGAVLWLVSIVGESVADSQLRRFKADTSNRGHVCRAGLWNYSRHPNYFFEWLLWCAFALFALASPYGWVAIGCPALMLYFLLRVSGIPLTEAHAVKSRPVEYREYQRTTPAFVPWRKKTNAGNP
jgi:steroid 5-alpha reductase family enzyme